MVFSLVWYLQQYEDPLLNKKAYLQIPKEKLGTKHLCLIKLNIQIIIEDVQKRTAADAHILQTDSNVENPTFPREYAKDVTIGHQWYFQFQFYILFTNKNEILSEKIINKEGYLKTFFIIRKGTFLIQNYHSTIQTQSTQTNASLRDRTLCLWLGACYLHFPTYTYNNFWKYTNWFQILITKRDVLNGSMYILDTQRQDPSHIYIYIKWTREENTLSFDKAKHNFSHLYFIYVGKDTFFILDLMLNKPKFDGILKKVLLEMALTVPQFNSDESIKDNQAIQADNKKGTFVKESDDLTRNMNMDFRLDIQLDTQSLYNQDIKLLLQECILWGCKIRRQKFSSLVRRRILTFHLQNRGNSNLNQNINNPADIEGLWTFIHFSHNIEKKRSVAFIKLGGDPVQRKDFAAIRITLDSKKLWCLQWLND